MKLLSETNQEKIDNPNVAPIWLMDITLDSSLTLSLCDRIFGEIGQECLFNGKIYEPLVIDWSELNHSSIDPITYKVTPSEIQPSFNNGLSIGGQDKLTKLLSSYDFHYADVTIQKIYEEDIENLKVENAWIEVADTLNSQSWIMDLIGYNDKIYGSTYNGGRLFEWNDTDAWIQVADKLGTAGWIPCLIVYNDHLYGGTYSAGSLYQWNDTDAWISKASQYDTASGIWSLCEHSGNLYGGADGRLLMWNDVDAWILKANKVFIGDSSADSSTSDTIIEKISSMVSYNSFLYGTGEGYLLKWNGSDAWEIVAEPITVGGSAQIVDHLIIFEDEIYGATEKGYLLKWNGSDAWETICYPYAEETWLYSLGIHNNELYAGTYPNGKLIKFNGNNGWIERAIQSGSEQYISAILSSGGELYAGTRTGGKLFKWNGGTDIIDIFEGQIEDPKNMKAQSIDILCSGMELNLINKFDYEICNEEDYPSADPDDLGKMFPIALGSCKRVPFLAIDAGAVTTIIQDVDDSETGEWFFTDVSRFPEPDSSSGGKVLVQMLDEQMYYTAKDNDNNSLTISERGANGTDATTHIVGDGIAEVKDSYIYGIDSISYDVPDIYVDDIRQLPNSSSGVADYTIYTGKTGDEHPSYPNKTIIQWDTNPVIKKQVNVSDDLAFAAGGSTKTVYPSGHSCSPVSCAGVLNDPGNMYDGNDNTYAELNDIVSSSTYAHVNFSDENLGLISKIHVYIKCKQSGNESSGAFNTLQLYSDLDGTWAPSVITPPHGDFEQFVMTLTLDTPVNNWTFYIGLDPVTAFNDTLDIHEIYCIIEYAATTTKTGGVAYDGNSSANIVIGGLVTADIQGEPDDSDGSITGDANSFIQRPGHITRKLIKDRCDLSLVENIDWGSHGDSDYQYASSSYRLGVCILEPPNPMKLFEQIAFQSKSMQFWYAGRHHLIFVKDTEATDLVIDANRIDVSSISINFTKRADIKNKLVARYQKHWGGYEENIEAERRNIKSENTTSISKFGELKFEMDFSFIIDEEQAQDIGDWIVEERGLPRITIQFSGGEYLTPIINGDIIEFSEGVFEEITFFELLQIDGNNLTQINGSKLLLASINTMDTFLQEALLGLITLDSDQFRIIARPENKKRIQIECIKI